MDQAIRAADHGPRVADQGPYAPVIGLSPAVNGPRGLFNGDIHPARYETADTITNALKGL